MRRRPPSATLTDSLSPYPAVFRSTLGSARGFLQAPPEIKFPAQATAQRCGALRGREGAAAGLNAARPCSGYASIDRNLRQALCIGYARRRRSEEHKSELQSLMRISYAVFCLQKIKHINDTLRHIYRGTTE